MRRFRWLSPSPLPAAFDLRRRGWTLLGEDAVDPCPALLSDLNIPVTIADDESRARTLLLNVDGSAHRARALELGFGEVLGSAVSLAELEQRAQRLARALESVPRRLLHGSLELDLLLRDGIIKGRRLGLHPREFGLLWRLARSPGVAVTPLELLTEVWRVNYRPETNSLAVHVCRLRAKLASAGLGGVVRTTPDGSYTLAPAGVAAIPLAEKHPIRDEYLRIEGYFSTARKEPTA